MKKKIILLFILVSSVINGQIKIPDNFSKSVIPEYQSEFWRKLNFSLNEYAVENRNNEIYVYLTGQQHKTSLAIKGGTLIAINHGEFGGELKFLSKEKTHKQILIKKGNIKFLFEYKNRIFFIDALAHMSTRRGIMYELKQKKNQFEYIEVINLEDAPSAMEIINDKILFASHENFYVVDNFKKKELFKNKFWRGLYPNSIAFFDWKNIFVGIRGGIVKLNVLENKINLYTEKEF
ncbi:hypothetical protein A8C32_05445 [Flavivirga aquatica]|uniref:Uncharacterized protein n=1 Tax=Flavivirga aquatica TaxID=1849968 RepID=A0A1E5SHQ9_9FLAO|nr:hypothetical protein [Flavivirga aquatica]OEJ98644.1 hypothetical protein A8C32_05445 [Flavivirga aquatica]